MGRNLVDWLNVNPLNGYADKLLSITASTMEELSARSATIKAYNTDFALTATSIFTQMSVDHIGSLGGIQVNDVPSSGATLTIDDCWGYYVYAVLIDGSIIDITNLATYTGSLTVPPSYVETRHEAGQLEIIASYGGQEVGMTTKVYQEAYVPVLTGITFSGLTWVTDVPASGGTATKNNCSYSVYGLYDTGSITDITSEASVSGSFNVLSSDTATRHSAGTLTLTASYGEFSSSDSVTIYQTAAEPYLRLNPSSITFNSLGGTAIINVESNVDWNVSLSSETPTSMNYLTFEIISGGTIYWKTTNSSAGQKVIEYSKNSGVTWVSITASTSGAAINVDAGNTLMFRGDNYSYGLNAYPKYFASSTYPECKFNVKGNIMSLIDSTNFESITVLSAATATFKQLFSGCTGLISAENLLLPATTLTGNATNCYYGMFEGCTGLTTAPVLPATALTTSCYYAMFGNCSSLTTAPELPATTLANSCYQGMFSGCTSLTTAPELPATTLTDYCYYSMFSGCTGLTTAPELPATTLAQYCYSEMFRSCRSLNYIKCLATDISAYRCTYRWVYGVVSGGTFVKNANMNDWGTGIAGIPSGWTVINNS